MKIIENFLKQRGAYILLFEVRENIRHIKIGKLGVFSISKGLYAYVGSAIGSGGFSTRICRHLRSEKKTKWHIDYLLLSPKSKIVGALLFPTERKLECVISKLLVKNGLKYPIRKFGSTDCSCPSHLFLVEKLDNLFHALRKLNITSYFYKYSDLYVMCFQTH